MIQRFGRLVAVQSELGLALALARSRPSPKSTSQNVSSSDYKSRVLTADVNLVDLRFAVQYRYTDPVKVLFRVREPEATLRKSARARSARSSARASSTTCWSAPRARRSPSAPRS